MNPERGRPFDDVRSALAGRSMDGPNPDIRVDPGRGRRTGAPEIVFGSGKAPEQVVEALERLAETSGSALATRCGDGTIDRVRRALGDRFHVAVDEIARTARITIPDVQPAAPLGSVAILAAGTSDLAVAREARAVLEHVQVTPALIVDVGVAGLHRLVRPLEAVVEANADALIVVAGMDGALPSVVTGLVHLPVIGVPVSTGYGFGGNGTGALMSMLQTCAPGLTVVNIDNGVGAALAALRIVQAVRRRQGA